MWGRTIAYLRLHLSFCGHCIYFTLIDSINVDNENRIWMGFSLRLKKTHSIAPYEWDMSEHQCKESAPMSILAYYTDVCSRVLQVYMHIGWVWISSNRIQSSIDTSKHQNIAVMDSVNVGCNIFWKDLVQYGNETPLGRENIHFYRSFTLERTRSRIL